VARPAIVVGSLPGDARISLALVEHHLQTAFRWKKVVRVEYGDDPTEKTNEAWGKCCVFVLVIGPRWQAAGDENLEPITSQVAKASRGGVLVLPVLVEGGRLPSPAPPGLKKLSQLRALTLTEDPEPALLSLQHRIKRHLHNRRTLFRFLIRSAQVLGLGGTLFSIIDAILDSRLGL